MKWLVLILLPLFWAGCVTANATSINDFVKSDGSPFVLVNNPTAKNVTLDELKGFLMDYNLVEHSYVAIPNPCGFAAEDLHNVAEAQEIRTAIVMVRINGDFPHVFNLFKVEGQNIYVDATTGIAVIAEKEDGEYKAVRHPSNQIQTQLLGKERDFLIFW